MTALELTSKHTLVLPHGTFAVKEVRVKNNQRCILVLQGSAIECNLNQEIIECINLPGKYMFKTIRGTFPVSIDQPGPDIKFVN